MPRYAVLDANGVVVNHILINDPLPAKYWPGYGAALVPLEAADVSAGAALDVHVLKISAIPQIGDTLDVATGKLTKFVPEIKQEEITKEDGTKETISVASAPSQKFIADVRGDTAKPVYDKADTVEVKDETKVVKGGK
jgi:hypothetical protein